MAKKKMSLEEQIEKGLTDLAFGSCCDAVRLLFMTEEETMQKLPKLKLINVNGEIVDEWTSDGTDHIVTELPAGDYTLKEIAAPDGYVIATDIKFTVDVYGNVTVENADAAAIAEDGTPIVIMVDEAKPSLPDTPHTVTTDNPHTGVSSDNGICIYLMIGSVMLLSLIFAIRKNNERRDV